jgi:hypothetical protein
MAQVCNGCYATTMDLVRSLSVIPTEADPKRSRRGRRRKEPAVLPTVPWKSGASAPRQPRGQGTGLQPERRTSGRCIVVPEGHVALKGSGFSRAATSHKLVIPTGAGPSAKPKGTAQGGICCSAGSTVEERRFSAATAEDREPGFSPSGGHPGDASSYPKVTSL